MWMNSFEFGFDSGSKLQIEMIARGATQPPAVAHHDEAASILVPPHVVFNWINNMFPVVPIYTTRSATRTCYLRRCVVWPDALVTPVQSDDADQSVPTGRQLWNLSADELLHEVDWLVRAAGRKSTDACMIVLFVDGVRTEEMAALVRTACGIERGHRQVYVCNEADFVEKYKDCGRLLFDDAAPQEHHSSGSERLYVPKRQPVYFASEIVPGFLFLGDFQNGGDPEQHRALGITHVIDATNVRGSEKCTAENGMHYLPIDVHDMPDAPIQNFFDPVIRFVTEAKKDPKHRVLIHCRAGWSRSPTLVMAYLVSTREYSLRSALTTVLRARPNACPNPGFCEKLMSYEVQHVGESVSVNSLAEFVDIVHTLNIMWSASTTAETDFDRVPIRVRSEEEVLAALEQADGEAREAAAATPLPKKPFLRKRQR